MPPKKIFLNPISILPRRRPASLLASRALRPHALAATREAHTSAQFEFLDFKFRACLTPAWRKPRSRATAPASLGRRTIFIQTENTPNPDAIKFLPNHRVLPEGVSVPFIEYLSPRATISPPCPSPLASRLMAVDGVTAVFYGVDFITIIKAADANWANIRPEVFSLITETVTSGQLIVNISAGGGEGSDARTRGTGEAPEEDSLKYNENDSEVVGMIKELLETRIRPAIQEDGGDIEFRGFENGFVRLKLRGACRTCDSSTVTLKNGIEGMLKHYIEEVKGVHQVLEQEEEIALREFAKFEEKLKQKKGKNPLSSVGKGALDTVPG